MRELELVMTDDDVDENCQLRDLDATAGGDESET